MSDIAKIKRFNAAQFVHEAKVPADEPERVACHSCGGSGTALCMACDFGEEHCDCPGSCPPCDACGGSGETFEASPDVDGEDDGGPDEPPHGADTW